MVFEDGTDIYFARQQVSERLQQASSQLPAGVKPTLGPVATGLVKSSARPVEHATPGATKADGKPDAYGLTNTAGLGDSPSAA